MDALAEIEANARARFASWDAELWRSVIEGPARTLAASLESASGASPDHEALLRSYLSLAAEAIGLGYLFPASAVGRENFISVAWLTLIPALLAQVAPSSRAETLAQLWNLGENLEASPVWLRRMFHRLTRELRSLEGLDQLASQVSARALEEPKALLGGSPRARWHWLGEEDRRFLPGAMHFVAPTVLCVHDRHRTAAGGRDAATIGIWLDANAPMLLGPMGCTETPPIRMTANAWALSLEGTERGITQPVSSTSNPWRAAVAFTSSQAVLSLEPS